MLNFSDTRWSSFGTTYDCDDVLSLASNWHAAVGFDHEVPLYRVLAEQFMHQCTITDLAFAIAPHIVSACESGSTRYSNMYLTDIGMIEANRLTPECRPPALPAFLADAYRSAVARAQSLAEDLIESISDPEETWELRAIKPALFGNADLAWHQWRNGFDDN